MNKMLVLVKAADGQVDALARWYDDVHLRDLLAVPGVVSVERHTLMPVKRPAGTTEWDFMMIYELEGDDPIVVLAAMAKAQIPLHCDALNSDLTVSLIARSQVHRTK